MRALAQLAVTMEALIKEKAGRAAKSAGAGGGGGGSGSDGRSSRNHARLLADLTAICLDPSTSFLRGFSAEKIASNIVTRLVDFGEPNFALRLLEAVMQSLQAPSTLGRRAELSRSARFTGKDSLSWRAFLDLLTFEYQGADSACSSPPPPNALIAACLLNAFKCVVTLFPDLTWQEFTTIAKSPFGLVPWFHRLKTENLDLGRRFFDIIFRFLYKLCSESVSAFPARCIALECFAETSLFDQTRFLELLGRYVVDDCKEFNPISLSNIVCWSFEQFVLRETHPSLLLPFVDRVFVLAKKHPQFQIPPAALNFADHLASKSDVTALDGFKRAALALYVMLECSMDSTRFTAPVANMNPIVTRILAIVSDCSWTGMLDAPALKLLYRIQEISKLVAQGLPASPNSDEKRAETAVMAADLSTSILLTLNQDFPEDRMKATVNAVIWMAADTAGILARQETAVSHSSSADQRALHLDRLTRAFRLCKKFDLPDVMKSTAVTSLSVGCSLLRRRLWDDALSFFVLSAECWESFELSVGRDWIKDEGNIKIFIRLAEAQSACHTGAGNAKGAAEVCAKAIWKLCDVCSHDLVNRLLEQFFRIAKDRPSLTFLELSKNMGVFDYAVEGVDMSLAARALKICGEEIKYRTQRLENRDVTVHIIDNCVTVARQNAIWAKTVLFLFEKAKVLRELGEASCGDVAKCCKDAIEIAAFADVLANCYFLLGLALNESKSFSMDPFQSALNKWQSLLLEVPPFLSGERSST
ncbi:hypothetical protein DFJ73DRAFT_819822 [Zopfochytrium polystomum]|nr:hypothetical protein DFJ73DRAFT_819822 [Zopfochytrium polystomum]